MRRLHVAIVVCSWSAVLVWMAMIFYALSTLLLLGVPFLAYGLDVIPDASSVWVATWIAAAAVWSLAVWPFAAAVSVRLKWARSYDIGA